MFTMWNIERQIQQGLIDGAVVLAGNLERDLYSGAWGYADKANHVPMTEDSVFDIASITKAVGTNSVLLAALTDGILELDRPFIDYLPEFTGKPPRPVTIRELALHISGVNINYCNEGSSEEMHRKILAVDFPHQPGTVYQYTCTNYILLGFLLEKLYTRDLAEIATERVFRPLRMTASAWTRPPAGSLSRTVRTINAAPGVISDPGARHYAPRPFGNAGIFTTAADLAKYARMLLRNDGTIFPKKITRLCFTDFNPPGIHHPHSIGWDMMPDMIPDGLSGQTIFHNGWTGQTLWIDPGSQRFVIVLTNRMKEWDRAKYGRKAIAEELLSLLK
ncbi:MAG: beta-lactamase family protein [Lentisphaeria bacterium]|nr:beta-lactamase family protein [Lentisphaeria bacterium]